MEDLNCRGPDYYSTGASIVSVRELNNIRLVGSLCTEAPTSTTSSSTKFTRSSKPTNVPSKTCLSLRKALSLLPMHWSMSSSGSVIDSAAVVSVAISDVCTDSCCTFSCVSAMLVCPSVCLLQ